MSNARCSECKERDVNGVIFHAQDCSVNLDDHLFTCVLNPGHLGPCASQAAAAEDDLDDHFYDAKSMTLEDTTAKGWGWAGAEDREFSDTFHLEPAPVPRWHVLVLLGCVSFGAALALGIMWFIRVGLI